VGDRKTKLSRSMVVYHIVSQSSGYDLDTIEFDLKPWESRTNTVRLITKVLGNRKSDISRRKVFDHVQNFVPTACDSQSQIGLV
jgi:hypothetical protein